jgi:hypothetical protein
MIRWLSLSALLISCVAPPTVDLQPSGALIEGDPNQDGKLNPGESATVRLFVTNQGNTATESASCVATLRAGPITFTERTLDYRRCDPAERCESTLEVTVHDDAQPGDTIEISCDLGDVQTDSIEFVLGVHANDVQLALTELTLFDDPNRDGVLNPGETGRVRVGLRNDGSSRLTSSHCIVGSLTPGVLINSSDDMLSFRNCDAEDDCGTSEFRINVEEASAGTSARFTCDLIDNQENLWPIEFTLPIERSVARPQIDTIEVLDDTDDDGQLSAGEAGKLRVAIQNIGPARLTRSDCVVTGDSHLEVLDSDDQLGYVACDADEDCGTSEIRVRALTSGRATLRCPLENAEGTIWPLQLELEIH